MKKLFIGTTKLGETQHHKVRNIQTTPDFLSATVAMLVIFGIERYFCIISDCRNSFINKPLVGGYYDMGGHYDIAYSQPSQISKMERLAKIANR